MGLLSRIAERVPRGVAVATMALAGLFGMRTPPDPPVTAQTVPARDPDPPEPPDAASLRRSGRRGTGASSPASGPPEPGGLP